MQDHNNFYMHNIPFSTIIYLIYHTKTIYSKLENCMSFCLSVFLLSNKKTVSYITTLLKLFLSQRLNE